MTKSTKATNDSEIVTLSSPWQIYFRKLETLFKEDIDVDVFFNSSDKKIVIHVDNVAKADALQIILPDSIKFGNVTLDILVIPSNYRNVPQYKLTFNRDEIDDVLRVALHGNKAFKYVTRYDGVFSNPLIYVVFKKQVVQYYSDNLGDIHGLTSTLYEELARDIFDVDGIMYCTDTGDDAIHAVCI